MPPVCITVQGGVWVAAGWGGAAIGVALPRGPSSPSTLFMLKSLEIHRKP